MDKIFSRPYSKEGRDNWDKIFQTPEKQWKKEFEDSKQRFVEWVATNTVGYGITPLDERILRNGIRRKYEER